jgi:hypothetical protein
MQHLMANNIAKTVSVCVVWRTRNNKCATKKENVWRNKLIRAWCVYRTHRKLYTHKAFPVYRLYIQPASQQFLCIAIIRTWHVLRRFKGYNLLIICNKQLSKRFNLFNFIHFVTLAYTRRDSLKVMQVHRNM